MVKTTCVAPTTPSDCFSSDCNTGGWTPPWVNYKPESYDPRTSQGGIGLQKAKNVADTQWNQGLKEKTGNYAGGGEVNLADKAKSTNFKSFNYAFGGSVSKKFRREN
jgi:hypothetical protein